MDSAKLIGGGRPLKRKGVKRSVDGSESSKRNRKEYMKDYRASQNSISDTGYLRFYVIFIIFLVLVEDGTSTTDEILDSCKVEDTGSDSNELVMEESVSELSTQDSNLSINRGGRPKKEKRKRGPGRGQKQQRN